MAYNFQERLGYLKQVMKQNNQEVITYSRSGVGETEEIYASPILMEAEEVTPGISVVRVEYQDWCIDVADLTFGSGLVVPKAGDLIVSSSGDTYKTIPLGGEGPCYRYTTFTRDRYRIHSQRISKAS